MTTIKKSQPDDAGDFVKDKLYELRAKRIYGIFTVSFGQHNGGIIPEQTTTTVKQDHRKLG